ncbi:hypothetical protein DRW41_19855 [Neobacillus piezotolerans]|uniref:Type 4 fimbrial biogenesis protein PilX N-terminal domain-containing protein n=1 Tax=Neobacillus piezotolerans TaxID=2259171 RepID=A0A3D8GKV2_9BACI|nr:hypothetical protein [Neobacillus piezotolerans]RDU35038.1 hypothetical protein DRW41_19855 [Neobacillus piezotolerans]
MRNEKGYTLILVLIIITITMIFALSLSGLTLSTRAQLNKTDKINKATDLAEMGVTFYQGILTKHIAAANAEAAKEQSLFDTKFYNMLLGKLNVSLPAVEVDSSNNTFKINFKSMDKQSNSLIVTFESVGQSDTEISKVTGHFTIQKNATTNKEGQPKPSSSYYSKVETNPVNHDTSKTYKAKTLTYPSSTYFNKPVIIEGSRNLTVNGDTYFTNLSLQGAASITIVGDAIFENDIALTGNAYSICVYGNSYKLDSTKTKLIAYPLPNNSCAKPANNEWIFDPNSGTKVKY